MLATLLQLLGRRLLVSVPILLLVCMLLFSILRVLPVDAAAMSLPPTATIGEIEAKRHEMGLDLAPAPIPDLAPGRRAWRFRPLDPLPA
jgi:ABC-type dipeptide/oligopeptide/nickel transport system permease component